MTTQPVTTPSGSALPTERIPRVPAESAAGAARRQIAGDPTLADLPPDAHVHSEHPTGIVFVHGRRLTLVEVHQDVDGAVMESLLDRREQVAKKCAAVVVAGRMTVGAARRAQHAGVRFVALGDLTG